MQAQRQQCVWYCMHQQDSRVLPLVTLPRLASPLCSSLYKQAARNMFYNTLRALGNAPMTLMLTHSGVASAMAAVSAGEVTCPTASTKKM